MNHATVIQGDALEMLSALEAASVDCCVTSPPYWGLRDYGVPGQIGVESSIDEYLGRLVAVFDEVRRVLRPGRTLWLNLGDIYANDGKWGGSSDRPGTPEERRRRLTGLKPKDMVGLPWRLAFALRDAGWWLRADCIWHKTNVMPESVRDRPTRAHEYLFLLANAETYYYDAEAIEEPAGGRPATPPGGWDSGPGSHREVLGRYPRPPVLGPPVERRNKRSVWPVASRPRPDGHFATFPPELVAPCILAGSPPGGVVLDPFAGSGTTLAVALEHGRQAIGVELNPAYIPLIARRLARVNLPLPLGESAS